jgi:type I restriction enzyme M protein
MTVRRRLDAVLEPTKQAVLDMKASLDKAGVANQDQALRQAAGQDFRARSETTGPGLGRLGRHQLSQA